MQIFKVPDLLLIIGSGRLNFYGSGSLKDRGVCGFPSISEFKRIDVSDGYLLADLK